MFKYLLILVLISCAKPIEPLAEVAKPARQPPKPVAFIADVRVRDDLGYGSKVCDCYMSHLVNVMVPNKKKTVTITFPMEHATIEACRAVCWEFSGVL